MTPREKLCLILLACLLCTPGCTAPFFPDGMVTNTSAAPESPGYRQTLAQPEYSASLIRTDTDLYTIGDVVGFVVTNEKSGDLSCASDPPTFSVQYQDGSGRWVFRMGQENPETGTEKILKPGESTSPNRFVTTGWAPGRYRIVSNCGVSREILLRSPAPVITAGTSCPVMTSLSPFIRIDAISDQYAGEAFTVSGATNLKPGEELRYSIFAIMQGSGNVTSAKLVSSTLAVSAGSCGTNTWSVYGLIQVPGSYFIGISDTANTVSAVRRFSVREKARPSDTATLPVRTTAPGILTG